MKREFATTLSVAAVAFTLLIPQFAQARTMDDSKAEPADIPSSMAPHDKAQLMVPAQAVLTRTLDARKVQPGQQIRVTLSKSVQFKDGLELPRGTELIGMVVADPANANVASAIVLRFAQAELKGGKVVPIVATIVGFYGPVNADANGHPVAAGNQRPNTWNSAVLEVDQIEPDAGVELQSKIASENSGTFVSTRKGSIKLQAGSEFALAIAVQKNG
jgi:hypothetical protein